MKRTLLITGAGGYVGAHLVKQALYRGYHVKAVDAYVFGEDKLASDLQNPDLEIIQADIRGLKKDTFRNVDSVVSLAGFSNDPSAELDPVLTRSVNFDGCSHVARLAKESGVQRYVEMSSCSVYGSNEGLCTEESSLNPQSLYAKIKAEVEEHLMGLSDNNFCATALRNSTCFGLSDRMRYDLVVNIMTLCAFRDRRLKIDGSGKQRRPLIHASDAAGIVLHLLDQDLHLVKGEIFNIGYGNMSVADLAGKIKEESEKILDSEVTAEHIGESDDVRDYEVSFSKFTNRFGILTTLSVEDGASEILKALLSGHSVPSLDTFTLKFYQSLIARHGSSFLSTFSQPGRY